MGAPGWLDIPSAPGWGGNELAGLGCGQSRERARETSRRAAKWFATEWNGSTFMAVGTQDPVLGLPIMSRLRQTIRGCPEPAIFDAAGHFVQEHDGVARAAIEALDSAEN